MKQFIVVWTLTALGVFAAAWFGSALYSSQWFWAMAAGALFLLVFVFETIIIQDGVILAPMVAVETAAFLLAFWLAGDFSLWLLAGSIGCLLFLIQGAVFGSSETRNLIQFRFFHISHTILSRAVIGLAVFLAFLSTHYLAIWDFKVPAATFDSYTQGAEFLIKRVVPYFSFATPVRNLLRVPPRPDPIRINFFGFSFNPDEPLGVILREATNVYLGSLSQKVKFLFLIVLALLLTVSLSGLSLIVVGVVGFLGWLFYHLFLALGLIKIVIEEKGVERIVL